MTDNIIQNTTSGIGQLLSYLTAIRDDIEQAKALINLLGWELPPGIEDIGLATIDVENLLVKLDVVIGSTEEERQDELVMFERILELTDAINDLVQEIRVLASELPTQLAAFDDYVERTQIHTELPKRLFDFLVANYLSTKSPLVFSIFHLINVIDYDYFEADPENFQLEHVRPILKYSSFKTLFTDPGQLAEEAYGWNTPTFFGMRLLKRLNLLFQNLGMRCRVQPLNPEAESIWLDRPISDAEILPQLITFLHEELGSVAGFRIGFSLFHARASSEGASDAGLGFVPIVRGTGQASIPFYRFDDTFIDLSADADLLKGITLLLRPEQDLELRLANTVSDAITGRFALGLRHGSTDSELKRILSLPGGSGLEIQQAYLIAGMEKDSDRPAESFIELGILGGQFTFSMQQGDSFLKNTVPQKNLESPFELSMRWTKEQGITFAGSAGLSLTMPVHADVGPFKLTSLSLQLMVEDEGLKSRVTVDGGIKLGPLHASVQGVGLDVDVVFEEGNLGILGLSHKFKSPNGLGLSIDGGGFKGGGFLEFESDEQRYVGFLELEFKNKISLKALGLLTTRLPDGSDGYSLLIIITAEFTPIQLGFGFTLNGVGGLLGLNRTANIERLRSGVKDNTLSSILFPQDIVANAGRIISDLRQVFPPQKDRFIFGPMLKIGWGSPTLITADVGLMIEVPNPVRMYLLGIARIQLPNDKERLQQEQESGSKVPILLQLQVNFLGVVDFDAQRMSFDASLYDSKLLSFVLSGDMAVRFSWGSEPNFLLSVGGFHPSYEPPPLALPNLQRLTLSLLSGNNPRLTMETYFAVTSNTVQFGARLDLYAVKSKFNVTGFLSLDVLFQLNPFYFIADIGAMLALKVGSRNIASIHLALSLDGPTPWHAKGTAKLKICWFFTLKVRFNKTFGNELDTRLDDVSVLPLLQAALANKGNWESTLSKGRKALVSVKEVVVGSNDIVVDPGGVLSINQKVVPLNTKIQKFGSQQPQGANHFAIEKVKVGEGSDAEFFDTTDVQESFAPAQFFEKTDEQKLTSKSFERFDSGVNLVQSEKLTANYKVLRLVEYELFYSDEQRNQRIKRRPGLFIPDRPAFNTLSSKGAVATSPLSVDNKPKPVTAPDAVKVLSERFAVVNVNNMQAVNAESFMDNETGAYQLMDEMLNNKPGLEGELQVVPIYEMDGVIGL